MALPLLAWLRSCRARRLVYVSCNLVTQVGYRPLSASALSIRAAAQYNFCYICNSLSSIRLHCASHAPATVWFGWRVDVLPEICTQTFSNFWALQARDLAFLLAPANDTSEAHAAEWASVAVPSNEVQASHSWRVQWVQPVDMFPQTRHVECVVVLSRF